jgi:acyl carrier protein
MKQKFLEIVIETLETDDDVSFETVLTDLDEWDSLGILSLMSAIDDEFGVMLTSDAIAQCKTLGDLFEKIK